MGSPEPRERLTIKCDPYDASAGRRSGTTTRVAHDARQPARRLLGLAETLDAHRGFADVIAALREGHGGTIGGTWGSASALAVAAVAKARATEAGTLVVVLPHAAEADDFVDDVALFSNLPALLLPAVESLGEDDGPTGDPADAERLAVVKRLTVPDGSRPPLVVTSVQALLAPLADPREIEAGTRRIEVGGRLDLEELADWLGARGWRLVDAIDTPGTFARRGGIVDLFAADPLHDETRCHHGRCRHAAQARTACQANAIE